MGRQAALRCGQRRVWSCRRMRWLHHHRGMCAALCCVAGEPCVPATRAVTWVASQGIQPRPRGPLAKPWALWCAIFGWQGRAAGINLPQGRRCAVEMRPICRLSLDSCNGGRCRRDAVVALTCRACARCVHVAACRNSELQVQTVCASRLRLAHAHGVLMSGIRVLGRGCCIPHLGGAECLRFADAETRALGCHAVRSRLDNHDGITVAQSTGTLASEVPPCELSSRRGRAGTLRPAAPPEALTLTAS